MKETLTRRELRELTFWCFEDPEPISEGLLKEFSGLLPNWNPKEQDTEWLDEKIEIKQTTLSTQQIATLKSILGEENLKLDPKSRVLFSHGQCLEDLVRIRIGDLSVLCDAVAQPETEEHILELFKFCESQEIPIIPVGGRTGVTRATNFIKPGIALSLRPHFTKIKSINSELLTVKVQAGTLGPELEKALNDEGLTFGHFPQSFEESTVGGWIAARAAGQNSTLYGKIEHLTISLRVVTPRGIIESPSVPAWATGPCYMPYFIGSEGTIGVITEATLRIRPYPPVRRFSSYLFRSFEQGIKAVQEINQGEFLPSIVRLSDGSETDGYQLLGREGASLSFKDKVIEKLLDTKGYISKKRCILLLVFEGSEAYVTHALRSATNASKKNGGFSAGGHYAKDWFDDRFEHPHLRDSLLDLGLMIDTLETIATWDKILEVHKAVNDSLGTKVPLIFAHLSHQYPSASALYFIYFIPFVKGKEIESVRGYQHIVLDTFLNKAGVVSHHHGSGKSFLPWAQKEWGENALKVARAIKKELDPKNIMNPGNFPI